MSPATMRVCPHCVPGLQPVRASAGRPLRHESLSWGPEPEWACRRMRHLADLGGYLRWSNGHPTAEEWAVAFASLESVPAAARRDVIRARMAPVWFTYKVPVTEVEPLHDLRGDKVPGWEVTYDAMVGLGLPVLRLDLVAETYLLSDYRCVVGHELGHVLSGFHGLANWPGVRELWERLRDRGDLQPYEARDVEEFIADCLGRLWAGMDLHPDAAALFRAICREHGWA